MARSYDSTAEAAPARETSMAEAGRARDLRGSCMQVAETMIKTFPGLMPIGTDFAAVVGPGPDAAASKPSAQSTKEDTAMTTTDAPKTGGTHPMLSPLTP